MLSTKYSDGASPPHSWPEQRRYFGQLFCLPGQVAIYSPADRLQPHRFKADESYAVGSPGMTPVQCYLDVEGVIAVAKQNQVDAIHPGETCRPCATDQAHR